MPVEPNFRSLVLDASVLVNFLRIDRLDLVTCSWTDLLIVTEVQHEVTEPLQAARLHAAIGQGVLKVLRVTDVAAMKAAWDLYDRLGLGRGEAFSFVAAGLTGATVAIDDNKAIKRAATAGLGGNTIHTTDIVLDAIRRGVLTVEDADAIKANWAADHNFTLKLASFADLLGR